MQKSLMERGLDAFHSIVRLFMGVGFRIQQLYQATMPRLVAGDM